MWKITASVVVAVAVLTSSRIALAPMLDLDSCHDDLDRLRKLASDASDGAESAKSEEDDLNDCLQDPKTYDLLGDGCRSHRSDYESALGDLESKLDDLDSRLRSIQSSCGYEFTINRMSPAEAAQRHLEAAQARFCASLRKLVASGLPPESVLKMCEVNADEKSCKACFGLK
jgi:hypothetical protein